MKYLTRTLQTCIASAIMFALPCMVSAANRTFTSVTPSPASASVTQGVATMNTSTVSVRNGSGASTRFVGTALMTTLVTPAEPSISATFSPVNLTYPNADTTLTSTLTVTTTTGTPAGTYIISVIANTNPPAQSSITPVTNTYTLNVGAVFVPQKTWSPGG